MVTSWSAPLKCAFIMSDQDVAAFFYAETVLIISRIYSAVLSHEDRLMSPRLVARMISVCVVLTIIIKYFEFWERTFLEFPVSIYVK